MLLPLRPLPCCAEECWRDTPNLVSRERAGGGGRPAGVSQQRASSSGYLGGYSSGGGSRWDWGVRLCSPAGQQKVGPVLRLWLGFGLRRWLGCGI
jgi:hypothetical protein